MIVRSYERTTGRGARHETQVLGLGGLWYPLSQLEGATRLGREDGFEVYQADLSDGVPVRAYHRSNSGHVETVDGSYAGPGGVSRSLLRFEEAP